MWHRSLDGGHVTALVSCEEVLGLEWEAKTQPACEVVTDTNVERMKLLLDDKDREHQDGEEEEDGGDFLMTYALRAGYRRLPPSRANLLVASFLSL